MKPHKNAELIKAWADGAEIETRWSDAQAWIPVKNPEWGNGFEYRIKPEPDRVVYAHVHKRGHYSAEITITCEHNWNEEGKPCYTDPCNIAFVFDGETSELKSVEMIK